MYGFFHNTETLDTKLSLYGYIQIKLISSYDLSKNQYKFSLLGDQYNMPIYDDKLIYKIEIFKDVISSKNNNYNIIYFYTKDNINFENIDIQILQNQSLRYLIGNKYVYYDNKLKRIVLSFNLIISYNNKKYSLSDFSKEIKQSITPILTYYFKFFYKSIGISGENYESINIEYSNIIKLDTDITAYPDPDPTYINTDKILYISGNDITKSVSYITNKSNLKDSNKSNFSKSNLSSNSLLSNRNEDISYNSEDEKEYTITNRIYTNYDHDILPFYSMRFIYKNTDNNAELTFKDSDFYILYFNIYNNSNTNTNTYFNVNYIIYIQINGIYYNLYEYLLKYKENENYIKINFDIMLYCNTDIKDIKY